MNDKDLKSLKRMELLELLLDQIKENDEQNKVIKKLEDKIIDLNYKLTERKIDIDNAGSLAEASLKLNGVFEAAQNAAQQYLDNLQGLYEREEENCVQKEQKTEEYVKKLLEETNASCEEKQRQMENRCAAMQQAAKERCYAMKEAVKQECEEMEQQVKTRCEEMEQETKERCEAREKEAEEKCALLSKKADEAVEKRWEDLSTRLEEFYKAHVGLRELLTTSGEIQRD